MNTPQYGENHFSDLDADEDLLENTRMEDSMINLFIQSVEDATDHTWHFTDDNIESLMRFLKVLTVEEMSEAMQIASRKLCDRNDHEIFKYFCGICHSKIRTKNTRPEGQSYRTKRGARQ